MDRCIKCGRTLTFNEIGAHKRFINRGSKEFFCLSCLSKELNISEEILVEKIEFLKKQGCLLFN